MAESFSFTDDEIQLLLEVCIEYKVEREYWGIDWELLGNKYEQIQEKLIQQFPKNSTDGFPNCDNAEQTLTVKHIGWKRKTIRTNFRKAVDTSKRCRVKILIFAH